MDEEELMRRAQELSLGPSQTQNAEKSSKDLFIFLILLENEGEVFQDASFVNELLTSIEADPQSAEELRVFIFYNLWVNLIIRKLYKICNRKKMMKKTRKRNKVNF